MSWMKNLNAAPRLMIAFGVLLLLTLGIGYLAIANLSQANGRLGALYQEDMLGSAHVNDIALARAMNGRSVRDALLHINDPKIVSENENASFTQIGNVRSDIEALTKENTTDTQDVLRIMLESLPAYEEGHREIYKLIEARDLVGAEAKLTIVTQAAKPLFEAAAEAVSIKHKSAQEKFLANNTAYRTARAVVVGASILSLCLGIVLSLLIARGFSIPLSQAVNALERVAAGDLTVRLEVDSRDEVGRMAAALNAAVEHLNETMQSVADSATSASASSQQLAAASEAIASGAQEQAASLEETSASLEQITATVRQSADNAQQASQLASGSKDSALQGQEVVSKAITAMSEINAASAKISDIISTIDEIAFQTNLLAVNAAVEAARAGEEGRGFAVVASEVRSLAQRSAVAAKEIKVLIQDSLRKVEAGSALVNRSGETLQGIVVSVKRVTDIVSEIAVASSEQSTGVEQVNRAMTQMDQVTQSNSAQTEELSATAEALAEQSQDLLEMVKTFTLGQHAPTHKEWSNVQKGAQPSRAGSVLKKQSGLGAKRSVKSAFSNRMPSTREDPALKKSQPELALSAAGSKNDAAFEEF